MSSDISFEARSTLPDERWKNFQKNEKIRSAVNEKCKKLMAHVRNRRIVYFVSTAVGVYGSVPFVVVFSNLTGRPVTMNLWNVILLISMFLIVSKSLKNAYRAACDNLFEKIFTKFFPNSGTADRERIRKIFNHVPKPEEVGHEQVDDFLLFSVLKNLPEDEYRNLS